MFRFSLTPENIQNINIVILSYFNELSPQHSKTGLYQVD